MVPRGRAGSNYGIHSLPNLETKFVAANSLIGLPHASDALPMHDVEDLKQHLWDVRHRHFQARSYRKKKELRTQDLALRTALAEALEDGGGFDTEAAHLMAAWDPYDQNTSATFLDPEWMFNVRDGFDAVIGNPPYVLLQDKNKDEASVRYFRDHYTVVSFKVDLFHLFIEKGMTLLARTGRLSYIVPSTFVEKIFTGPLARMTREALDYIRRNYLTETVVKHDDRAEAERFWNVPYPAIEEAVINAVYHRSYEIREPVEVRISPEDLVVLSFPGPDRSINMDDLRLGRAVTRRYRNRRIGEFLKELDLTEGRSTGIPKILRAMEGNGSPLPEFRTDDDRTYYLVRLPVRASTVPVTAQDTDPVADPVTDPVGQILALLRNGELSPNMLRQHLGLSHRQTFRENYLHPALDAGFIEMTIPDKPTSRNQKYRLTEKGRAALRS